MGNNKLNIASKKLEEKDENISPVKSEFSDLKHKGSSVVISFLRILSIEIKAEGYESDYMVNILKQIKIIWLALFALMAIIAIFHATGGNWKELVHLLFSK